jgi:hypothetical protein
VSTRRLAAVKTIPLPVLEAFYKAPEAASEHEALWRERSARMTLDALGFTNITRKAEDHNEVVLYARRWFQELYTNHPDPKQVDNSRATFECAGLGEHFDTIKSAVLSRKAFLLKVEDD